MRTAFINELIQQARIRPDLFLIAIDLGYSVVEPFAREFPNRYLNAGIAEQNATGLAAGLASEGYHVFTYSIANFPTFRCAEQIRNDIAYHKLPVTVVAVGGGLAYGNLGYSHHAVQDYALIRSFSNMLLAAPGDPAETRACLRHLVANPGPSYLRLGKAGEPLIHKTDPDITEALPLPLINGTSAPQKLILSTGAALKIAHDALFAKNSTAWTLSSLPLWSEKTKPQLARHLSQYAGIITVEDHLHAGGFGSYVRETLDDAGIDTPVRHVALDASVCGLVASQAFLNEKGGLGISSIHQAIDSFPN